MFHLFWFIERSRKKVDEAWRRNDAAHDDLREALERLLSERNQPRKVKEREG